MRVTVALNGLMFCLKLLNNVMFYVCYCKNRRYWQYWMFAKAVWNMSKTKQLLSAETWTMDLLPQHLLKRWQSRMRFQRQLLLIPIKMRKFSRLLLVSWWRKVPVDPTGSTNESLINAEAAISHAQIAEQLYWNHTSAWVSSCKFATYFQNSFS